MADTYATSVLKKIRGIRPEESLEDHDQEFVNSLELNCRRAGGQLTKGTEIGIAVTLYDFFRLGPVAE